ncbi:TrbG/VirB9 family P-type conjugative transfer protein [Parachitinimonas caeni]|uniref:TrbG/VirB9 family P-type conjugative transfer protein n=1 Tax=Parachitinimonas caeni TaxID=3031301 RepID=A0ABT7E1Z1_9NEIS|nr:TrbG/VirB9 family P-type conjugative transfer protein [Parachitinimonas caeni]MDK2126269.1 TrbG/VirB9 family P-type conjugative transfer protein [Parachitinimonas caeni]
MMKTATPLILSLASGLVLADPPALRELPPIKPLPAVTPTPPAPPVTLPLPSLSKPPQTKSAAAEGPHAVRKAKPRPKPTLLTVTEKQPLDSGGTPGTPTLSVYHDPRLVAFAYDPDRIFPVMTKGGMLTTLAFQPGEKVTGTYFANGCVTFEASGQSAEAPAEPAGCDAGWRILLNKARNLLLIKPMTDGLDNNAIITTNHRTYQLWLASQSDRQYYQRVSWRTPELTRSTLALGELDEEQASIPARATAMGRPEPVRPLADSAVIPNQGPTTSNQIDLGRLNLDYQVEGRAPFRPTAVFDDGNQTVLRLPPKLEALPVLFAIDEASGKAEILDAQLEQGNFRFAGIRTKLLLKLGDAEIRILRKTADTSGWLARGRE